ncbi:14974_t:CDS:2 [Acaulospora colombiana]|uniref:14974_t:CDS:1 n=1 Tax=Acaulospora colombiana TaxID=27376 RepID=A0ACA9KD04_9GLOM|nr:14974_t:CDS:2 [Acaulospora colombiana]
MSISPFLSSTHTMDPVKVNYGECRASALQTMIWANTHCQSLIDSKTIHAPTSILTSTETLITNTASRKSPMKSKQKRSKSVVNEISSPKSNKVLSLEEWKAQDKGSNESKSRQKKRPNSPSNDAIESLDGEGDIGAVFENNNSQGFISQYESPDISKLKERFNFASFDCGAIVLKANKEAKGATAILSESKDTYVLNKCSATKFVELELCEDILIEYVALANFEFFSSTFKDFRISISNWYPPKEGWKLLGQYTAKNLREIQVFSIKNPIMFARYLRIDFDSHYGHQHYCPVSLFRVHGSNEYDKFKRELEEIESPQVNQQVDEVGQANETDDVSNQSHTAADVHEDHSPTTVTKSDVPSIKEYPMDVSVDTDCNDPSSVNVIAYQPNGKSHTGFCPNKETRRKIEHEFCPAKSLSRRETTLPITLYPVESLLSPGICLKDECSVYPTKFDIYFETKPSGITNGKQRKHDKHGKSSSTTRNSPVSPTPSTKNPTISSQTHDQASFTRPISNGGTQESIFKTIMKRLSLLESNANLSKRHIEEQNKILKDIASMIEKTQIQQITIANQFNESAELMKNNYEGKLNSAILSIDRNLISFDRELKDLYARTQLLVNQIILAKKLGSALALLLLIYVGVKFNWSNVRNILMALQSMMNERATISKFTEQNGKSEYPDHIQDNSISRSIEQIRLSPYRSKHNLKSSRNMLVRPIRRS